jgi:hypothetical protein
MPGEPVVAHATPHAATAIAADRWSHRAMTG